MKVASRPHRRKSAPAVTREAIIAIASRLFQERGYHATGLEEVARELGVTRPALYHYFRSKQQILYEIHRTAQARLVAAGEDIKAREKDPLEALRGLIYNHVMTITDNAEFVAVLYQDESALGTRRRNEIRQTRTRYTAEFARVYELAVERGEVVPMDPKLAAFLMLGACNWIATWYRPGTWSAESIAENLSRLLVRGVQLADAPPRALAAVT